MFFYWYHVYTVILQIDTVFTTSYLRTLQSLQKKSPLPQIPHTIPKLSLTFFTEKPENIHKIGQKSKVLKWSRLVKTDPGLRLWNPLKI